MASLREKVDSLPNRPGVYFFKDRQGEIIYVGKAKNLRRRVASYFRPAGRDIKKSILLSRLRDLDYQLTASYLDALILEDRLIKKHQPRYNFALRDDKAYPFLKLTVNETWPRLVLARRKEADGALYFGRYQGGMVRAIIRLVKKLFPLRWCRQGELPRREQPCLYHRIGVCAAPCQGKISRQEYLRLVEGVKILLSGKMELAREKLRQEMERASAEQDYEKAATFRDSLKLFDKLLITPEERPLPRSEATGLLELQQALELPGLPSRLECFDVSNLGEKDMVAAMVVFQGGSPAKKDYRRFNIKTVQGKANDVAALAEAIARRYRGSLSLRLPLPDLLLVDGGRPQVSAAAAALKKIKISLPLVGLAKKEEEIFLPGKTKPIMLAKSSAGLQLLQRARDEAHRFAINFHRRKRGKRVFL
jgi:excinuclease ABC subunit C